MSRWVHVGTLVAMSANVRLNVRSTGRCDFQTISIAPTPLLASELCATRVAGCFSTCTESEIVKDSFTAEQ